MGLKEVNYNDIKDQIQPGDIIAFSGKTYVDEIIKFTTRSNVSHIGIVLKSSDLPYNKNLECDENQIMEALFSSVIINCLENRIENYDGAIWWLPLKESIRTKMNIKKYYDFILQQQSKKYDIPEAIKSAIDIFDKFPFCLLKKFTYNIEDISKVFCSELATAALEESGAIANINASEVTPIDLCMFNIYKEDYYQLKGERTMIKGYNTISPFGWGQ